MHSPVVAPAGRHIVLLLLLIIVGGAYARFASLGTTRLGSTELPWHLAAKSASTGGGPTLPSGVAFDRSVPMIRTVSALQNAFRNDELSARIPAATLGTLSLFLLAGFAWLVAGPWAAVGATFLLAFYPEAVAQSRSAGLYSQQQFLGILALGAGWLATARSVPQTSSTPADLVRRWVWAAVSLAAFVLATMAHLSGATVFVGFATWVLLLALISLWLHGPAAIFRNLAIQLTILGLLAVAGALVLQPHLIAAVFEKVNAVPAGVSGLRTAESSPWFYASTLASQFGWVLTLLPVLVLLAIGRHTWLTIFLVLWFIVPLILHSFVITRKEERLLLMAVPALLMLAGLAFSEGKEILSREVGAVTREWLRSYRSAVRAGNVVVAIILAFALISLPAFAISLGSPRSSTAPSVLEWSAFRRVAASLPGVDNVPLGALDPLVAYHYAGRVDFTIASGLDRLPGDLASRRPSSPFRPAHDSVAFERQTGAVMTRTMDEIRAAFSPYGEVHIVTDPGNIVAPVMDRSVIDALEGSEELCQGRCGRFRLYRVKLGNGG
jgi:4-amino-4-deoxy-L-arabinose transferase-like glycosyltransferase